MDWPSESGEMPATVMLDSTPLGKLAHPTPSVDAKQWLVSHITAGSKLIIPEIADYEVRRSFLLARLRASIARLDELKRLLVFQPITTSVMLRAADLWADSRRRGRPTADPRELDGDVILAAQAIEAGAIVATENVGHLGRYVTAADWRTITTA
jgi:predicted nucleic acid-binding protein